MRISALAVALLVALAAGASEVEVDTPAAGVDPAAGASDAEAEAAISSAIGDTPAELAEPAAEPAAAAAAATGYLERSTFTTGVSDREPMDSIETLGNDTVEVAFFTDVRDMTGGTLTHRWVYGGEVMAEVPFDVGGSRWRVHSTKQLDPEWIGEWTVSVVDTSGRVLATQTLLYTDAGGATAQTATPAAGSGGELGAEAAPAAPPDVPAPPAAPQP